jgi:hypothetical protein
MRYASFRNSSEGGGGFLFFGIPGEFFFCSRSEKRGVRSVMMVAEVHHDVKLDDL